MKARQPDGVAFLFVCNLIKTHILYWEGCDHVKLLSVGLTETAEEVRGRLQQDFRTLTQEGFRVAIDEINRGNYTFLGCNVIEGELSFRNYERIKNLLKNYVAKILAELIILREEKKLVRRIIEHNYYYFSDEERNTIYEKSIQLLNNGTTGILSDFGVKARHGKILSSINEYLDNNHELVLEGFINFRLKDYRMRLVEIVDNAVDNFVMDLEYKEFIRVLRYFVDIQEPKVEEVHVIINEYGNYQILDTDGKSINNKQLENFIADSTNEINFEDLLITALITISPYSVVLHNAGGTNSCLSVINTIQNIFEGRVAICAGCAMCAKDGLES